MNCPYCLSDVAEEAVVCKTCSRDLYLFKPLLAKIEDLEKQIAASPSTEKYESRISELEGMLETLYQKNEPKSILNWVGNVVVYLAVPLLLLLLAHWLIAVVYDTKMVYLRIISMVLPLPFGYFLFKDHQHRLFPWFIGVAFLSVTSVIGMSWITSMVDHSPIFPQSLSEWREVIEYAASIAFSFLTGMLLGGVAYTSKQRRRKGMANLAMKTIAKSVGNDGISLGNIHSTMKTLQDYGGTIVALGTTALSIYTGLKGIIGS